MHETRAARLAANLYTSSWGVHRLASDAPNPDIDPNSEAALCLVAVPIDLPAS